MQAQVAATLLMSDEVAIKKRRQGSTDRDDQIFLFFVGLPLVSAKNKKKNLFSFFIYIYDDGE